MISRGLRTVDTSNPKYKQKTVRKNFTKKQKKQNMHLCINLFFSHCKFLGINAEYGFVGLGDFLPRHRVIESTFPRSKIR